MNAQQAPGESTAPITAIVLIRHPGRATPPQGRSHAGSREDSRPRGDHPHADDTTQVSATYPPAPARRTAVTGAPGAPALGTPAHRNQTPAAVPAAGASLRRAGVRDAVADHPVRPPLSGGPHAGRPRQRHPQAARPRTEPLDHPHLPQRRRARRSQPAQRGAELPRRQGGQQVGVLIGRPAGQLVLPPRRRRRAPRRSPGAGLGLSPGARENPDLVHPSHRGRRDSSVRSAQPRARGRLHG